jgi:hypothetical protein
LAFGQHKIECHGSVRLYVILFAINVRYGADLYVVLPFCL